MIIPISADWADVLLAIICLALGVAIGLLVGGRLDEITLDRQWWAGYHAGEASAHLLRRHHPPRE